MKIFIVLSSVILSIGTIALVFSAFYSGKTVKRLIINAALGITAMITVNLIYRFTGVRIPVNTFSVIGVSVFSVPAVIALLLLKIICLG